ncbi:type VII secretion protein EccE [Mycobacterium sp. Marseille-P9652]|uniref:type VII secretion protein EccE n=1 Tax=Mycobacterium sp. Marseille-P9652 TaxID=2654950 RepID=UPI0012E8B65A|nr:type VII secretion protein EccE [Mycobacterium sp. Marseille-P9652]
MSRSRSIPTPGTARITLALLAVVPAVLAYPWRTTREQWLLGIAVAVAVLLFGWWRGLHFTTILGRRLAITRRKSGLVPEAVPATMTTALLRLGPSADDAAVLPLPLIAGYLDRYGIRADKIRITNRDNASDAAGRETWIALTVSAVDNLAALRARSPRIPLQETAQVVARRLADQLREAGWEATAVGADDIPRLLPPSARETWRGVQRGAADYIAAYQVSVSEGLAGALDAIRAHPARETVTALEIAGDPSRPTVAAACAFGTETRPAASAPLPGLIPQRGNHRPALAALDLASTRRLDGHTDVPAGMLAGLDWPMPAGGAHRAAV